MVTAWPRRLTQQGCRAVKRDAGSRPAETAVPLERDQRQPQGGRDGGRGRQPERRQELRLQSPPTGLRQHTANYPGVTVERRVGRGVFGGISLDLIDLPGTYSLSPTSADEKIAVDVLFGRVAAPRKPTRSSPSSTRRVSIKGSTYCSSSTALGRPMVVALTMIDAAEREGARSTSPAWKHALGGVPVYPVVATSGRGFPAQPRRS